MFTAQKIAAVSGLVTSLAAICLGAPFAYADDGNCATTAQGDTICIRKSETQTDKDNARAQKVYDRIGGTREEWLDYWLDA
jgi:hypothetical protein